MAPEAYIKRVCRRQNKHISKPYTSAHKPPTVVPEWSVLSWHDCPTTKSHTPFSGHSGKKHPGRLHYLFTVAAPQQTFLRVSWGGPEISTQDGEEGLWGEVRSWYSTHKSTRIIFPETVNCISVLTVLLKWFPFTTKVHISGVFTKCSACVEW